MASKQRRIGVYEDTLAELGISPAAFKNFFIWWEIYGEADPITGEPCVSEEHHKALCDIASIREHLPIYSATSIEFLNRYLAEYIDLLVRNADSKRQSLAEFLSGFDIGEDLDKAMLYVLGDPTAYADALRSKVGLIVADIILDAYQKQAQKEGIYETD